MWLQVGFNMNVILIVVQSSQKGSDSPLLNHSKKKGLIVIIYIYSNIKPPKGVLYGDFIEKTISLKVTDSCGKSG